MQTGKKLLAAKVQQNNSVSIPCRKRCLGFSAWEADALPTELLPHLAYKYLISRFFHTKNKANLKCYNMQENALKCAFLSKLLAAKVQQISNPLGAGAVSLGSSEESKDSLNLPLIFKNQTSLWKQFSAQMELKADVFGDIFVRPFHNSFQVIRGY